MFSDLPDDIARAIVVKAIQLRHADRFEVVKNMFWPVFAAFEDGRVPSNRKERVVVVDGTRVKMVHAEAIEIGFGTIRSMRFVVEKENKKEEYIIEKIPGREYFLCHVGGRSGHVKAIATALKEFTGTEVAAVF
jgi:hypothetical protein